MLSRRLLRYFVIWLVSCGALLLLALAIGVVFDGFIWVGILGGAAILASLVSRLGAPDPQ